MKAIYTRPPYRALLTLICTAVLALTACSAGPAAGAPTGDEPAVTAGVPALSPTEEGEVTYTDPYAYCAAVSNADTPGREYVGEAFPDALAQALKDASGASEDAPMQLFQENAFWRCMDGHVYACTVGANLPCESKAVTDVTPTTEMNDFCDINPNAEVIPAVVTGHDTVYQWRCAGKTPTVVEQVFDVDAQGYIANIWYRLPGPATP
ncbi:MAG: hypothetical protein VB089_08365 [Anaerolineaceae bacterium]|nr:hypothetical protein [Anaerolineaceae bacterium]